MDLATRSAVLSDGALTYLESAGTVLPYIHSELRDDCAFCGKEVPGRTALTLSLFESPQSDAKFSVSWARVCRPCYKAGVQQLERLRARLTRHQTRTEVIHKGDGTFMTTRLQKYIDSRGESIPNNYEKYRTGGSKAGLCVFCDNTPADYPVYKYALRQSASSGPVRGRIPTQTSMCADCFEEAKDVLLEETRTEVKTLFQDEVFSRKSEAAHRIRQYLYHGKFLEDVEEFYQHKDDPDENISPDEEQLPTVAPLKYHCYFCGELARNNYKVLEAPVIASHIFTGGKVRYCKSCEKYLQDLQRLDPKVIDLQAFMVAETCDTCQKYYSVNSFEHRSREVSNTINKHMCPVCTFKSNFKREQGIQVVMLPMQKGSPDARHATCQCQYCNEEFTVDLTLPMRTLRKKHSSPENKVGCSACYHKGKFPIFVASPNSLSGIDRIRCYSLKNKVLFLYFRNDEVVDTALQPIKPEDIPFVIKNYG